MAMKNNRNQLQFLVWSFVVLSSIIYSCKASKDNNDKKIDKAVKGTLRYYHHHEKWLVSHSSDDSFPYIIQGRN
jgi:hypothetical protein